MWWEEDRLGLETGAVCGGRLKGFPGCMKLISQNDLRLESK